MRIAEREGRKVVTVGSPLFDTDELDTDELDTNELVAEAEGLFVLPDASRVFREPGQSR